MLLSTRLSIDCKPERIFNFIIFFLNSYLDTVEHDILTVYIFPYFGFHF